VKPPIEREDAHYIRVSVKKRLIHSFGFNLNFKIIIRDWQGFSLAHCKGQISTCQIWATDEPLKKVIAIKSFWIIGSNVEFTLSGHKS